jgi:hypothetical protein
LRGILSNAGAARFGKELAASFDLSDPRRPKSPLGTLAFTVDAQARLDGTLSSPGASPASVLAGFNARPAIYSADNPVPGSLLNQPVTGTAIKGVYNVAFPAAEQNPAREHALYPQGDGYVILTLTKTGGITLAGSLADGSGYSASAKLRLDGYAAFFAQLYGRLGGFGGELHFADATDTDVTAANCLWVRPAQPTSRYYPNGWPQALRLSALGTKYAAPASLDFGQGAANPGMGNASLLFQSESLANPLVKAISLDPLGGTVLRVPASNPGYTFKLRAAAGEFSGFFTDTGGRENAFRGILLGKGANRGGFGYFLGAPAPAPGATGESGRASVDPAGP